MNSSENTFGWEFARNGKLLPNVLGEYPSFHDSSVRSFCMRRARRSFVETSRSGTSAALAYDPQGRLVKTTVNGTDTNLLYDGQNMVGEYDSTGKLVRRYVFGPGVDAPLVQYEGAVTTSKNWLYADQQGRVVALANASGATTGSQTYGPFGETGGTPASRFGYTGQQYLAPLGLYYYKARMYSPAFGRFLQTDPWGIRMI
jgi:YD repeat-containing protein